VKALSILFLALGFLLCVWGIASIAAEDLQGGADAWGAIFLAVGALSLVIGAGLFTRRRVG
jgi:uncharacterized membrane protein HdeD (DUF308 family)